MAAGALPVGQDQVCSGELPCADGLYCRTGACDYVVKAKGTCDPMSTDPQCAKGLTCDAAARECRANLSCPQ
jgi:hypothetical protein